LIPAAFAARTGLGGLTGVVDTGVVTVVVEDVCKLVSLLVIVPVLDVALAGKDVAEEELAPGVYGVREVVALVTPLGGLTGVVETGVVTVVVEEVSKLATLLVIAPVIDVALSGKDVVVDTDTGVALVTLVRKLCGLELLGVVLNLLDMMCVEDY